VSEVKNHIALNKNNKKIIPEILGTQEVEIRRTKANQAKTHETPSQPIKAGALWHVPVLLLW
jgi:hypothetical protein